MTKSANKPFTVLLLKPDYASDAFGQDTALAHVEADGTADAVWKARAAVGEQIEDFDIAEQEDDLFVIAVFEGHLQDVQPRE